MLAFQDSNIHAANIPAAMRARAASLFRCGFLLGAAPSGDGGLSSPMPDPTGVPAATCLGATSGTGSEEVGFHAGTLHAEGAPMVPCPLVSIGSAADTVWPDAMCKRWAEIAAMEPATHRSDGRRAHLHVTIEGEPHIRVMNHKETMAVCFREIGVAAAAQAAALAMVSSVAPH